MSSFVRLLHPEQTQSSSRTSRFSSGSTTFESVKGFTQILTLWKKAMTQLKRNQQPTRRWRPIHNFLILVITASLISSVFCNSDVDPPTRCESCAIFSQEFEQQTAKIRERTEASAIELIEEICQRMLEFKVHKEKSGLERFSRDESATMSTLKKLKERGVKVEIDLPYELWDQPAAEITELRQQCELIVAEYEDELIEWFISKDRPALQGSLCVAKYLRASERSCLPQTLPSTVSDEL